MTFDERVKEVAEFGLTERQAGFLVNVMLHSGVFVRRQYCAWAGLTQSQAEKDNVPHEVAIYPWGASGRAQAIGRIEGLTKWLIEPESGRVLGCGMVCHGASHSPPRM